MLEDATGSIMFPTVSPGYFISITCAQCKLALDCKENRVSVVDLQVLLTTVQFWGVMEGLLKYVVPPSWRVFLTGCTEIYTFTL